MANAICNDCEEFLVYKRVVYKSEMMFKLLAFEASFILFELL